MGEPGGSAGAAGGAAAARRIGRLLRGSAERKCTDKSAGEQQAARATINHHDILPCVEAFILARQRDAAPVAFLGGSLRYFSAAAQSKTSCDMARKRAGRYRATAVNVGSHAVRSSPVRPDEVFLSAS